MLQVLVFTIIIFFLSPASVLADGSNPFLDSHDASEADSRSGDDDTDIKIRDISEAPALYAVGKDGRPVSNPHAYRIGANDVLQVDVFQAEELSGRSRVDEDGYVSLPLLGQVQVRGLTIAEAEDVIEKILGEKYLQNPHARISIMEYESQKITIDGQVNNPGIFALKGKTSLLQAITNAKGLDHIADGEEIVVFRKYRDGKVVGYKADLYAIREGRAEDPLVYTGDVIVVPAHGGKAFLDATSRAFGQVWGIGGPAVR